MITNFVVVSGVGIERVVCIAEWTLRTLRTGPFPI